MPRKARIAIIGAGYWSTTAHLPGLTAHPNAEIVAVCDQRQEALDRAAEKYAVGRTYVDVREMLAKETIDGVVVAVWHSALYEVARLCLEQKLHVLVEKPMALFAPHARDLVERARQVGREIILGSTWNFSSRAKRAREVVKSGTLGTIRCVNCYYASGVIDFYKGNDRPYGNLFPYPVTGPGEVYSDPKRSGGGQGQSQATHLVALMHFITGLKPVAVAALMDNLGLAVDVVDVFLVKMNNGALVTASSTGNLQVSDPGKLAIQVNCDHGWLDIDFVTGNGRIRHADETDEVFHAPETQARPPGCEQSTEIYPLYAPVRNLVDVIVGKDVNGSIGEVGWRTVELLDAAYRSADSNGRVVSVDSLYENFIAPDETGSPTFASYRTQIEDGHELAT